MQHFSTRLATIAAAALILSACSQVSLSDNFLTEDAQVSDDSVVAQRLKTLPPPAQPVVLAVYSFEDKTGQHKPSDDFPEYSRAVTQGGTELLNKALYDAGRGSWFRVLEREGLNNLVQERKIIRATRAEYAGGDESMGDVGPLLYAGLLLEGAIVSYETNVVTGGAGAHYLGVGGNTQYRRDVVTVALRAISVKTGEVLLAVNTSKTIFSTAVQGGVNKFVAIDELLEIESGFSLNEPPQYAVRQAIEMAVYSMIVEGSMKGLWDFRDATAGRQIVRDYLAKRGVDEDELPPVDTAAVPERSQLTSAPPPSPVVESLPVAPVASELEQKDKVRSVPEMTPEPPLSILPPPPAARMAPPPPAMRPLLPRPVPLPSPDMRMAPPPTVSPLRLPPPPRSASTIQQLPQDAKPNPGAAPVSKRALETDETDPQNMEVLKPYDRRGVVYCGPSGCVPSYDAPTN